jgi:ParB family chromosome partitioning protein
LLEEATKATTPETRDAAGVQTLRVGALFADPDQPRKRFDPAELEELADSIRQHGVIQPILARPRPDSPGDWLIVAGERRWRAAQRAGLEAVPVILRDLTDLEVREIALIENLQRADLTALEEAGAYRSMMTRHQRSAEEVGAMVGKSRSHVANTVRLLALPPGVLALLQEGRLTPGHARALIDHPNAEALADRIVSGGLNVRQTEALVRDQGGKPKAAPRPAFKDPDTRAMETDLTEVLGMPVEIADSGGAGRLTIQYRTLEQLDELCRRLLSRPSRAQ